MTDIANKLREARALVADYADLLEKSTDFGDNVMGNDLREVSTLFDPAAAVITTLYDVLCNTRAALWAIEDSAVESGFPKLGDILADRITEANAAIELAEAQS